MCNFTCKMNFKIFIPVTLYYVYRDDDNDKSDDDENERIDFSVNTQARDRIKIQNDFLAAEHGKKQNYFLRKTFIAFLFIFLRERINVCEVKI